MKKLTFMILSSLASVLFLQVSLVAGQDAEITENILPVIKRMGVTGQLDCVVINQLDNPVYWIQKGYETTISTDDKITIDDVHNQVINGYPKYQVEVRKDGEKVIYSLIINRLEPRDSGNYTCQILVRGSNLHPSKDGELIVLVPPAIVLSTTSNTATVKEHENRNLTCDATGYPTPNITWVRVSADVLPNGVLRHENPILPIIGANPADRGVYRCLADNNVRPPAYFDITLFVYFAPLAKAAQTSYGQAENRMLDITIECRIAGYPDPELQWYLVLKEGGLLPINNDDKHTVNILLNHANILSTHERWFQLVIRTVQAGDYGNYICEGKNNLGTGRGTVKLFATSECQGPNCPDEQISHSRSAATSLLSMDTSGLRFLTIISTIFVAFQNM